MAAERWRRRWRRSGRCSASGWTRGRRHTQRRVVNGPTGACGPRKLAEPEGAIEVGGECSGRLGHEEDDRVALGEGVSVITVLRCHPSVAADTVQLLLRGRVTPLGVTKDDDGEVLLGVAKRDEVPIGAGGSASAAGRAVALRAGGEERSVALELPACGRGAKADEVRDVSLVDVGVVTLPLRLGGRGPVALSASWIEPTGRVSLVTLVSARWTAARAALWRWVAFWRWRN